MTNVNENDQSSIFNLLTKLLLFLLKIIILFLLIFTTLVFATVDVILPLKQPVVQSPCPVDNFLISSYCLIESLFC